MRPQPDAFGPWTLRDLVDEQIRDLQGTGIGDGAGGLVDGIVRQVAAATCAIVSSSGFQASVEGGIGGAVTGFLLGGPSAALAGGGLGATAGFIGDRFNLGAAEGALIGGLFELGSGGRLPGVVGGSVGGGIGGIAGGTIGGAVGGGLQGLWDVQNQRLQFPGRFNEFAAISAEGAVRGGLAGLAGAAAGAAVGSALDAFAAGCMTSNDARQ